jgi:hypothetical protein
MLEGNEKRKEREMLLLLQLTWISVSRVAAARI